jgi:2-oxo-3-hexenedioate decarboxylase
MIDPAALAERLRDAYTRRSVVPAPSAIDSGFDLPSAYAVEHELVRLRALQGHRPVGLKVGFANRAAWRALKLDTLAWAHMYDDTVHEAPPDGSATLRVNHFTSPKIEPEIVFKLKEPIEPGGDAEAALRRVEWIALGFEIIDCVFPEWKFSPADFVAAYGLHAGLVIGPTRPVLEQDLPRLLDALSRFTVKLLRNGDLAAEGSGRNSLRSPAACLAELATAVAARGDAAVLGPGALVSSGTLTESQPMSAGETWSASVEGFELPPVSVHLTE